MLDFTYTHTHTHTQDKMNYGKCLDCIENLHKWLSES